MPLEIGIECTRQRFYLDSSWDWNVLTSCMCQGCLHMLLPNNTTSSETPQSFFVRLAVLTEDLNDTAHCKIVGISPQEWLASCPAAKLEPHISKIIYRQIWVFILVFKRLNLFPFFPCIFTFLFMFYFLKIGWYFHKRHAGSSKFVLFVLFGLFFFQFRTTVQQGIRSPARITVTKAACKWRRI